MPVFFNPIAIESSITFDGNVALGSLPVGRTLRDALHCPNCGAAYNLLVPAEASVTEVEAYCSHLRDTLTESCGMHPPVVQSG
jgi:hypothetical protein